LRKADNPTTVLRRCHEIGEPYLPGTLWATPDLKKDCFTFLPLKYLPTTCFSLDITYGE